MAFVVLVKNNNVYDIIATFSHKENEIMDALNAAYSSGSPITGMAITGDLETVRQHKLTATYGSTWNGSSFSGGRESKALDASQEQLDSFDLFVFLCDNVLVGRVGLSTGTEKAEMFKAAFATETLLVKVPDHQTVFVGETYGWNGTEFTPVE